MKPSLQLLGLLVVASLPTPSILAGGAISYALSGAEAGRFALPADVTLLRTLRLARHGLTYERYQQRSGGAAVLGGQITLLRDASGVIVTVVGSRYPEIVPRNSVRLSHAAAKAVAGRDPAGRGERRSELLVDPDSGRYFYRIETRRRHERWFHWVDAETGRVLRSYDGRQTDHGIGVKGDVKSLSGLDGQAGTTDDLTTFHNGAGHGAAGPHWDLFSSNDRQKTYDARNGIFLAYPTADVDNHWTLVTPGRASPGQPALVDAQYYAQVSDGYLLERQGLDWIAGCGYPAMRSIAHYDADYVNAFWDGSSVVYGDGDGFLTLEFSGALDIVAHEHTHGVTQCTSNLIYQDESGALNESFSDMMGSSAEFYAAARGLDPAATPDWWIGEDVFLLSPSGFRSLADPAENFDPDHYSERQIGGDDNGGVHTNSGIPNHAFYLVVNGGSNAGEAQGHPHSGPLVAGIGVESAERIFFLAFTGLAENATMCDARAASEVVASALFGDASQERLSTTDAWVAVGLTDVTCNGAPLEAPANLTATVLSSSRINLAWTDNSGSEDGFELARSSDGGSFIRVATLGPNATSFPDTALVANTAYFYRVRAFLGTGRSDYSNVAEASTLPPPVAPTSLSATAVSSGRINLAWVDNSTGEAGFKVERSTDGVTFAVVFTLGANASSVADTTLAPATQYYYRVRAYEGPNYSGFSNVASATTLPAPAPPTGLTATPVSSSRINLAWTDNATNESGYKVERSADGVSFSLLAITGANAVSYSNTSLTSSTPYHYRVAATNGSHDSAYSNVAPATTLAPPAAPSNLVATAVSTSRINLTWVDNSTYEQGFKVERSSDGVNFAQIAVLGANATSYANLSLAAGTAYHYRVRAYDGPNHSGYSNVASATTQTLAAPTSLTATPVSSSRINLAWTDNASNEAGFALERSTDGVSFTQIAWPGANVTSFANLSLASGAYSYRVRAYEGSNSSGFSNVASATTLAPPAAPSNLVATAASTSRINLSWTDNATYEQGFKVERSSDGVNFAQIAVLAANAASYANLSLAAGTTYHYRVRAYDGPNHSGYSSVASATTQTLAAPTGLTATPVSSSRINLAWTDDASNEAGFVVERSTDGVSFVVIAFLGANATSHANFSLTTGTTYHYRVRAYDGPNYSGYSNVAAATTP